MEYAIRDHLMSYLAGDMTLDEFEEWFVPTTFELDVQEEPGAASLANEIQLVLAERARGHLGDLEFRQRLTHALEQVDFVATLTRLTASSAVTTQAPRWRMPSVVVAGRRS